ncbi:MAG: Pr6Pr family membrane protein [Xanthomonadaceae bacterium]|jgi:hypothetical protein|nr:Pr6Pr family membrane protein [Xanthomonadaceae bacterium]MDE2247608.1 Pr6Pr family membrane protein [Xanthomonadaceae bacterium]
MPNRFRLFAAFGAALGWLALALQLLLSIQLTVANGQGAIAGAWLYLGFFTVLTNLLVAAALTAAAGLGRGALGRFFRRADVHTALAMSIIIVCAVYNLMLRQLWHPHGWQIVADNALHVLMPLLFVLHWWLAVPKAALRWSQIAGWQAYPAAYFVYALARGALTRWYPYPFLDVTTLGYPQVLLNACAVLLAFVAVAALLLALARWQLQRAARANASPAQP